jgi:phage terminase small subunit
LQDFNGTQAATRAGYAPKSARVTASVLLTKPNIQAALEAERDGRRQRLQVSIDRVVQEAARLAYADIRRLFDADGRIKAVHELDEDIAAAVASIEVVRRKGGSGEIEHVHRIRLHQKLGALDPSAFSRP